jgi:hypothetical protein
VKIAFAVYGPPRYFDVKEYYDPVRKYILDAYDTRTFAAIYEPYSEREYGRAFWLYSRRSYWRNLFLEEFSKLYGPIGAIDCKVFLDELPRMVSASEDLPRSTGRTYAHRGLYSQYEMWKLTGELIRPVANEYDLVIKYRTDAMIRGWGVTPQMMEEMARSDNTLFVASSNGMGWTVGPDGEVGSHKGQLGLCESMWICRPDLHLKVVSIFDNLREIAREVNTIRSEIIFRRHITRLGIRTTTFPVDLHFPDPGDIWPDSH